MAVDAAERADCGDLTPPAEQGPEGVLAVLLAGGRDAMVRRRQQADLLPARLASRADVEHEPDAAVVVRASIPAAGEPRPAGRHHALLPQASTSWWYLGASARGRYPTTWPARSTRTALRS
jgi:hypothetical protein